MKNHYFKVFLILFGFISSGVATSQCNVTVSPLAITIDCGQSVDLMANGMVGLPALSTDFNNNAIGPGWLTSATMVYNNPCGPSLDGTPSAWFGDVPLPRTLTTIGFDMSCGGTVCFDMDYGGDDANIGSNCEDPDLIDEGVHFQYSVNGGATWVDIQYFQPTSNITGPYYTWANYCFVLPAAAWSTNTMFQWDQPQATSSINDHWGIDNVFITPTDCGYWYNWDNLAPSVDNPAQTVAPLTTTTYNVVYTNGSDSCTTDVTVTVNPLIIDATASAINLGCNDCSDLNAVLLNASPSSSCQEFATASGTDVSTVVTVNSFPCVPSNANITAVTLDGTIGSYCPSWYDFDILIDGVVVQTGLCSQTGIDLSGYLPFNSVSLASNDNDAYTDNVTLDMLLNIAYSTPQNFVYSWTPATFLNDASLQAPESCPNADVLYTATLVEQTTGCTATDTVSLFYTCNNCNLDNSVVIGACDPTTNTYNIWGNVQMASAPATGYLIVELTTASGIIDTTLLAPFTNNSNWSISGISSDGLVNSVHAYFSEEPNCFEDTTFVAPAPCVNCSSDVGSYSITTTGDGQTDYILCYGDQIDITTNGDWIGPDQVLSSGPTYDPGVSWMMYSCPPSVAVVPNVNFGVFDDPCFIQFVSDFNLTDMNDYSWINAYPAGTFTNNTIYWVPITSYSIVTGSFSYTNGPLPCYEMGTPIPVQYLPEYATSITQDCASGTATVSVSGGLPFIDGSNYTASALQPVTANFMNTTTSNNGSIIISGLQGGEMYSFDLVDNNGCPHTVHGGPFPSAPVVSFVGNPLSGCEPLLVEFTNTTNPVGQSCFWDFGDGTTSTNCGSVLHTYYAGTYDVSLTVTNLEGCSETVTYTEYVHVDAVPEAYFSYNPQEITIEDPVVEFNNSSYNAATYTWDFGDNSANSSSENTVHQYPSEPGDYLVTLWAYNDNNSCYDSIQQVVHIQDILLFYVPNIFTPDGDDYNERFQPVFVSGYDPYDYHLSIFNRWGEIIFESYNVSGGWNGHYGDGGLVADGLYIWTIDFKESMSDRRHERTGHVIVMK